MNWSEFLSAFITIFLAEMGDKTQFAAFAASAHSKSLFSVLLGVILALASAGALGVFLGKFASGFLSPDTMRISSGILFIVIGICTLFKY